MRKVGRPMRYTPEFIADLDKRLKVYIQTTDIPFIKEFAWQNDIPLEEIARTCAKRCEKFSQTLKKLKRKQETQLAKLALDGKVNVAMAIFALKNVSGWRDKIEDVTDDERLEADLEFAGVPTTPQNGRFKKFYEN